MTADKPPAGCNCYSQGPGFGETTQIRVPAWVWVLLGMAATGVLLWVIRREIRQVLGPREDGDRQLPPPGIRGLLPVHLPPQENPPPVPEWATIGNTVKVRLDTGVIHGYVMDLLPGGLLVLRVRRHDGEWHPDSPPIDSIISVSASTLVGKSRM